MDIDECTLQNCGSNSICINTVGNFTCECNTGFQLNEVRIGWLILPTSNIISTVEVQWKLRIRDSEIRDFWKKSSIFIKFLSISPRFDLLLEKWGVPFLKFALYKRSQPKKSQTCTDINECNLGKCSTNSKCSNTFGSYSCEAVKCQSGFEYSSLRLWLVMEYKL